MPAPDGISERHCSQSLATLRELRQLQNQTLAAKMKCHGIWETFPRHSLKARRSRLPWHPRPKRGLIQSRLQAPKALNTQKGSSMRQRPRCGMSSIQFYMDMAQMMSTTLKYVVPCLPVGRRQDTNRRREVRQRLAEPRCGHSTKKRHWPGELSWLLWLSGCRCTTTISRFQPDHREKASPVLRSTTNTLIKKKRPAANFSLASASHLVLRPSRRTRGAVICTDSGLLVTAISSIILCPSLPWQCFPTWTFKLPRRSLPSSST